MIAPGSTLGVMGGGQLGRMFAIEARKMGYRVHVFDPSPACPAGQVADLEINAEYRDESALARFAEGVSTVTFEFENIPAASLNVLSKARPVHPSPEVLLICQNREREKTFLERNGYPVAPFAVIDSPEALREGLLQTGTPAVLKTADFGYDGKGQLKIDKPEPPGELWERFGPRRAVLEGWITHEFELSVVCAGSPASGYSCFPAAENVHTRHILDVSIVPARIDPAILEEAESIARSLARDLSLTGLLAVEFFLDSQGGLIVNELAPRPHNSGHYTFDACVTSQFEQQVRTLCNLPAGSTQLLSPVVMVNLLGDLWNDGEPDWNTIFSEPSAKLHLYGKNEPRPGRKMGHFCVLDPSRDEALRKALNIRANLGIDTDAGRAHG